MGKTNKICNMITIVLIVIVLVMLLRGKIRFENFKKKAPKWLKNENGKKSDYYNQYMDDDVVYDKLKEHWCRPGSKYNPGSNINDYVDTRKRQWEKVADIAIGECNKITNCSGFTLRKNEDGTYSYLLKNKINKYTDTGRIAGGWDPDFSCYLRPPSPSSLIQPSISKINRKSSSPYSLIQPSISKINRNSSSQDLLKTKQLQALIKKQTKDMNASIERQIKAMKEQQEAAIAKFNALQLSTGYSSLPSFSFSPDLSKSWEKVEIPNMINENESQCITDGKEKVFKGKIGEQGKLPTCCSPNRDIRCKRKFLENSNLWQKTCDCVVIKKNKAGAGWMAGYEKNRFFEPLDLKKVQANKSKINRNSSPSLPLPLPLSSSLSSLSPSPSPSLS